MTTSYYKTPHRIFYRPPRPRSGLLSVDSQERPYAPHRPTSGFQVLCVAWTTSTEIVQQNHKNKIKT